MRFPWQKRADDEARHREAAEQRLADVEADWPRVHSAVDELRTHRDLNGWTGIVRELFADTRRTG